MRGSAKGFAWVLAASMACVLGCGNDTEEETGTGGTAGTAGTGGTAGAGGTAGTGGMVGDNPPVIDYVEWEYGQDCTGDGPTTLRVTVSAKDADDPTGETLTYTGTLIYCDNFSVTSTPSPVTETPICDLFFGLESLEVTVTDPQDNEDTIGALFESATCEGGCVENDEGTEPCP